MVSKMRNKIIAAIIIIVIILVGVFLLVPHAFEGTVPDEYIPGSEDSSVDIHWQ